MLSFFKEVGEELKKLHMPSKKETYLTTVTIVVTVAIVSLSILLVDIIISKLMGLLF
jgi:preprotein translocase SecE subunit